MSDITNTANDSLAADVHRDVASQVGPVLPAQTMPKGTIEAQEAAGQRELLKAAAGDWAKLPTRITGATRADLEALGFEFGEPVPGDDLFTNVRLPEGWHVDGTSHSMHTTLRDPEHFKRAGIFYKAAYYDRRADLSWMTVPVTDVQDDLASGAVKAELGDDWSYPRRAVVEDGSRAVRFTYERREMGRSTGHLTHVVLEPNGTERSRETAFDAERKGEWV